MEMLFALVIVTSIIIIVVVRKKYKKHRAEKKFDERVEYLTDRYGHISQCIPYLSIPDSVFVFEETQYLVVGYVACKFDLIRDVRLDVISQGNSGAIRDIVVGGMLLGTIGALAAANNARDDDACEYVVTIFIDSLSDPVISYQTDDYNIANRLLGIIRVIIDRNKSRLQSQQ